MKHMHVLIIFGQPFILIQNQSIDKINHVLISPIEKTWGKITWSPTFLVDEIDNQTINLV